MTGLPVLVPNDENSNPVFKISVNDRIREDPKRKCSPSFSRWRAQPRVLDQKFSDTFELLEKATCNSVSRAFNVYVQCVGDVLLCSGVDRVGHRGSLARNRAMASCPGTTVTEPDSSSASRRSASRSQASSTSGSTSRLAIRRSSKCDRSAASSFRTSASKTSRFVLTLISRIVGARQPVACHNKPGDEQRGSAEAG